MNLIKNEFKYYNNRSNAHKLNVS